MIERISRLPSLVILPIATVLALFEAYMVLASIMLLRDLIASGPDAEDNRLEGGLTWGVEALFVGVLIAGAIPLVILIRSYQYKKRMRDEGY